MKRILFALISFFIVVLCWNSPNAFQDATKPYTFAPRDTIKATKLNANWDTLYSRTNDLYDSLDVKFIRFNDFRDSTIDSIKANRIMGNPSIDSIQGLNVLRGNPDIDSISGTTKFTGAKTFVDVVTFSSTASVDSLFSTKGIKAPAFTGNVQGTLQNPGLASIEKTVSSNSLEASGPLVLFNNETGPLDSVTSLTGTYANNGLVTFVKTAGDSTFFNLGGEFLVLTNQGASITFFNVNGSHFLVSVANR